jgi:hypothetical protein
VSATVTLSTGEVVPTNSAEWRHECWQRWQDVVAMRSMSLPARRAKLAQVEAKAGAVARKRLEDAFRTDWGARREQA